MNDLSSTSASQSSEPFDLSPAGQRRRERMLADLTGEMQRIHRARRARRVVATLVVPALLVALVALVARWPFAHQPQLLPQIARRPGIDSLPPAANIVTVRNDAGVLERYRASSSDTEGVHAEVMSDQQLLDTLAAINRPTGLVRTAGRVWLTESVTDDPPASNPDASS